MDVMSTRLTQRQVEILNLISHGLTYAQVSDKLGINRDSVKTHLVRVYEKLDATCGPHAVRRGFETGALANGVGTPLLVENTALRAELARVYAALVTANTLLASRPAEETTPSHPFGDLILRRMAA